MLRHSARLGGWVACGHSVGAGSSSAKGEAKERGESGSSLATLVAHACYHADAWVSSRPPVSGRHRGSVVLRRRAPSTPPSLGRGPSAVRPCPRWAGQVSCPALPRCLINLFVGLLAERASIMSCRWVESVGPGMMFMIMKSSCGRPGPDTQATHGRAARRALDPRGLPHSTMARLAWPPTRPSIVNDSSSVA